MYSETYSQLTNFGIINSLRTGNILLDVIIAFMIPIIMSTFISRLDKIQSIIKIWVEKYIKTDYLYRTLEYTQAYDRYGDPFTQVDDNTNDLMKAINLYINKNFNPSYQKGEYKYIDNNDNYNHDKTNFDEDSKDDNEHYRYDSRLQRIKNSLIISYPEKDEWVYLSDTLSYKCNIEKHLDTKNENSDTKNKSHKVQNSITLRSKRKDGKEELDAFVRNALDWRVEDIKSRYKKRRYMYILQNQTGNRDNGMTFKKYVLSNYKTFNNIFIPDKNKILEMIDTFQKQEGKFSITGFPKQLSIMLTGPPGTGKTSLTKAISQYTGRHIIDIPIGKIKTNQELYELMFDNCYSSEDGTEKHGFKHTLFLIEDIDCISNIVYKRDIKEMNTSEKSEYSLIPDKETDVDDTRYLKSMKKMKAGHNGDTNIDRLNMSGLLNVIDGVIDCPQRMLIITTNHPEKLDPALTRPGRVNIQLHLDYVTYQQTIDMISYYISNFTPEQQEVLYNIFKEEPKITPATLEKLCVCYDDIDSILNAIQNEINIGVCIK